MRQFDARSHDENLGLASGEKVKGKAGRLTRNRASEWVLENGDWPVWEGRLCISLAQILTTVHTPMWL